MNNTKFNVLIWDFNSDQLEYYDILPYLRKCYEERLKNLKWRKVPKTFDEFKQFIEEESQYQFWARCEYEIIIHGWPPRKNDYKLDVHEQIMMNIDIITQILFNEFKKDE